jgi:hypothetical protein
MTQWLDSDQAFRQVAEAVQSHRLCCTNQLMDGVPLSLDRLIPQFQ